MKNKENKTGIKNNFWIVAFFQFIQHIFSILLQKKQTSEIKKEVIDHKDVIPQKENPHCNLVIIKSPTDTAFLSFPIQTNDKNGNQITPFTAKISSILDHSGTLLDSSNKIPFYSKDNKVKAFNGEYGDSLPSAGKPFGYTKQEPSAFFQDKKINYVGAYDANDKYPSNYFLNYDGHSGYDFPYAEGLPIIAPADGILYKAETDKVDGTAKQKTAWEGWHAFYIDHQNGFYSWLLHCKSLHDDIETEIGNDYTKSVTVKRGDIVAYIGGFGYGKQRGMPIHLHFDLRDKDQNIIDPYADNLWLM